MIYDFKGHKIGDCVAAAYCLQGLHLLAAADGAPRRWMGVINRGAIDVSTYFPDIADEFCAEEPDEWREMERVPLGNLWLAAPSMKLQNGIRPVMTCPLDDEAYDVALHCLTDAEYNTGRNHTRAQFDEIARWLNWHGLRVWRVPEVGGRRSEVGGREEGMSVDEIIREVGRARCYIGGDTGFTHCFAAMHPDRPLIAIYGDDWGDVVGFEEERERMGCVSRWCSDPLSFRLYKRVMREHRFDEREVKGLLEKILKCGNTEKLNEEGRK